MVGDDPEMLVSDLQNQFPRNAIEIKENDAAGLVAKVVDLIDRPDPASQPPSDALSHRDELALLISKLKRTPNLLGGGL